MYSTVDKVNLDNRHLVIGIATYKRPTELARLLNSISLLKEPDHSTISVLIADNEGDKGSGTIQAKLIAANFRFPITIIGVSDQGISSVRNAILEYAFKTMASDFLAMVDDDEIVSSRWLAELMATQEETKADLVGGMKLPKFSQKPEPWMPKNDVYYYQPSAKNGLCQRLVSTDNLLFSAEAYWRYSRPMFDLSFNVTGGGDTEFLQRLNQQGATLAYSKRAISEEVIPEHRMTLDWARRRSYRIGIGLARINILHSKTWLSRLPAQIKLVAILFASALLYLIFLASQPRRIQYQMMMIKQLGKIAGYLGHRVEPYKSP